MIFIKLYNIIMYDPEAIRLREKKAEKKAMKEKDKEEKVRVKKES